MRDREIEARAAKRLLEESGAQQVFSEPTAPPPPPPGGVDKSLLYNPAVDREKLTDLGNARRLVAYAAGDLRHVRGLGWHTWDGRRFARDDGVGAMQLAKATARAMLVAAARIEDADLREKRAKWAIKSQSASELRAMVALAKTEPEIDITPGAMNLNPWLLTLENGTYDLAAGVFRDHDRADLITKLAPVRYDADATCPRWDRALTQWFPNDPDAHAFLQRFAGLSCTGTVEDAILLLLLGEGENGKSLVVETWLAVLGDYAQPMAFESLVAGHRRAAGGPTEDIASLFGARFVAAVEGEERRLNESLVKRLTGNDTIRARFLRENSFSFRPTWKLVLATNHKPTIAGDDHAIWRRVKVLLFPVRFAGGDKEDGLTETFRAEASGILNWMVKGCGEYREYGLGTAPTVVHATQAYRREQDTLGAFLLEWCETNSTYYHGDGAADPLADPTWRTRHEMLYGTFTDWCARHRREPLKPNQFGKALTDRGYPKLELEKKAWRMGVRLLPDHQPGHATPPNELPLAAHTPAPCPRFANDSGDSGDVC